MYSLGFTPRMLKLVEKWTQTGLCNMLTPKKSLPRKYVNQTFETLVKNKPQSKVDKGILVYHTDKKLWVSCIPVLQRVETRYFVIIVIWVIPV